jgi:hypothetical protein
MANYTYEELLRIANAVRNAWAFNYQGGYLPGMSKSIMSSGEKAFEALQGDVIEIAGGGLFSGQPIKAIIAMKQFGHEEALRIENGYAPFDMKPGFLKSPKASFYKDGRPKKTKHFIVSFRHTTPKTTGILGKKMSPSVHHEAKKGGSFEDQAGSKEDPSDYGLVNSKNYEWQNGPLAGMTNIRDEKGQHSQFRTFRVISENSDPGSWWHPGVDANPIIDATVAYVEPYVKEGLKVAAKAEIIEKIQGIFSHPMNI